MPRYNSSAGYSLTGLIVASLALMVCVLVTLKLGTAFIVLYGKQYAAATHDYNKAVKHIDAVCSAPKVVTALEGYDGCAEYRVTASQWVWWRGLFKTIERIDEQLGNISFIGTMIIVASSGGLSIGFVITLALYVIANVYMRTQHKQSLPYDAGYNGGGQRQITYDDRSHDDIGGERAYGGGKEQVFIVLPPSSGPPLDAGAYRRRAGVHDTGAK